MKTVDDIFNAIQNIYELNDSPAEYLSDEDKLKVKELIRQGIDK